MRRLHAAALVCVVAAACGDHNSIAPPVQVDLSASPDASAVPADAAERVDDAVSADMDDMADAAPVEHFTITPVAGPNGTIFPSTPQVVAEGSSLSFTAQGIDGHAVNAWTVDGVSVPAGTIYQLVDITTDHTVSVNFTPSQLYTVSSPTLALVQNGNARSFSIGIHAEPKFDLVSTSFPAGTVATNNCVNLTTQPSCSITITPGATSSSDASGTPCTAGGLPMPTTITLSGIDGTSLQLQVYVLGYGCQYEGGSIFAIDDTTPTNTSIGGKVVSLVDSAAPGSGVLWASNGSSKVDNTTILDISDGSTTAAPNPTSPAYPAGTPMPMSCNGATDGACDSSNIVAYYDANAATGTAPTPHAQYAAGLCTQTMAGYMTWYLPSICELDAVDTELTCPTGTQSIAAASLLTGTYWSSTELSAMPSDAWAARLGTTGTSQLSQPRSVLLGVRCVHAL